MCLFLILLAVTIKVFSHAVLWVRRMSGYCDCPTEVQALHFLSPGRAINVGCTLMRSTNLIKPWSPQEWNPSEKWWGVHIEGLGARLIYPHSSVRRPKQPQCRWVPVSHIGKEGLVTWAGVTWTYTWIGQLLTNYLDLYISLTDYQDS